MRYAIVSDIHANYQAWESVLADIDEQGADVFICLGDVIGYGPMPQAVLDGVRDRAAAVVLGNHDAAVCGRMDASIFNKHARTVIDWTREKLDDEALQFLSELPLVVEGDDVLFVHAETIEPGRFDYILEPGQAAENLKACKERFVFYGHTHYPCAFSLRNGAVVELADADFACEDETRYLVNVGSAGEPRNPDDLRARYVLFDAEEGSVVFRRVEFDIDAYRADLERERLDIKPYFIQIADLLSGHSTEPVIPGAQAMRRLPVVPATQVSNRPRRLVVSARQRGAPPESSRPLASRIRKPMPAAPTKRAPISNRTWTILTIAIAAALIPVLWLVVQRALVVTSLPALEKSAPTPSPASASPAPGAKPAAVAASARTPRPAAPAPTPAASSHYLKDRLLSYWPANDKDESVSGRLRIGPVLHGKPRRTRGKFGNAYSLNQNSGYAFGDANTYAIPEGGSLTISFWHQPQKPGQQIKLMVGTDSPHNAKAQRGWSIYTSKTKVGALAGNGEKFERLEHEGAAPKGNPWRHVAVVIDATDGELLLYSDGLRVAKKNIASLGTSIPSTRPLRIGFDNGKDKKFNYQGKIDDLAIWERPLSLIEIGAIYKRGDAKREPLGKLLNE